MYQLITDAITVPGGLEAVGRGESLRGSRDLPLWFCGFASPRSPNLRRLAYLSPSPMQTSSPRPKPAQRALNQLYI